MGNETLKILFFGDITGRLGRNAVKSFLASDDNDADFVIANIENASHGFGLTKKNYIDLSNSGINCFTSGNHIWDKKDVHEYINEADNLVRPINYPAGTPGKGSPHIGHFKFVSRLKIRVFKSSIASSDTISNS